MLCDDPVACVLWVSDVAESRETSRRAPVKAHGRLPACLQVTVKLHKSQLGHGDIKSINFMKENTDTPVQGIDLQALVQLHTCECAAWHNRILKVSISMVIVALPSMHHLQAGCFAVATLSCSKQLRCHMQASKHNRLCLPLCNMDGQIAAEHGTCPAALERLKSAGLCTPLYTPACNKGEDVRTVDAWSLGSLLHELLVSSSAAVVMFMTLCKSHHNMLIQLSFQCLQQG